MSDLMDLPIDRIADAVAQRLEGRFEQIDERFERLEGRFDGLERKTEHRFEKIERQMDLIVVKIVGMDEKIENLQTDMTIVKHQVGEVHNRLDESVVATKRNEEEIVMTQARCERIEDRVSVLEAARP